MADSEKKVEEEEKESEEEKEPLNMKASFKKKLAKKDEELEKAKADMEHWKNEYYKAYADMANLRKDIQKDHQEVIKYRVEGLVDNLLPVLDAFDIALKADVKNEETKNYLLGFKYVYTQLLQVLEGEGIQVIEPSIDSKFDEKTMHAVETIESDGEEHLVKKVNLKGYKLYDHLVRAAMVVTSVKHKEENKDTKETTEEKVA